MTPEQVNKLTEWITTNVNKIQYGEMNVKITKHDGHVQFIEKTISEKEKC